MPYKQLRTHGRRAEWCSDLQQLCGDLQALIFLLEQLLLGLSLLCANQPVEWGKGGDDYKPRKNSGTKQPKEE